nr:NAD-dependent epimerase/dehydratase family protein [Mycolicibacterium baixiangningiae]
MSDSKKVAVAGATGQIGSQVVELLRNRGFDVVPVSRSSGADVLTGTGLAGGPDKITFADLAGAVIDARGGAATVVVDPQATYFGTPVDDTSLVAGDGAVLASTRFGDWLVNR